MYNSKQMLENWFKRRTGRKLDVLNGFCVTALHEKQPGELTAILQESSVIQGEPKGTVFMDLKTPDELHNNKKWKPADEIPFWKVWKARNDLKKKMTLQEKEIMYYIGLGISKNTWYYMDRIGTSRGPCNLPLLRDAWTKGIIDGDTLIYGTGLSFWTPIRNVRTLSSQIRTSDVKLTSFLQRHAMRQRYKRVRKLREKNNMSFSDNGYKQVESMV